jgi:hypothetical protein
MAILSDIAFSHGVVLSERPHVLSLPALGALLHIELHGLALLKALQTSRSDCRGMHKNVVATLAANEAVASGVVEPLHRSLFCHVNTVFLSIDLCWRDSEVLKGRLLACWVRGAHDRFGLTHSSSYVPCAPFATRVDVWYAMVMTDVPRDMRSSNSAHLSSRREAASIRCAAVERNSLPSAHSAYDVDLSARLHSSCHTGAAKARINKFEPAH